MSDKMPEDKPRPRMVKPPSDEPPARPRMVTPPSEDASEETPEDAEPKRPRMVQPPRDETAEAAEPPKPRRVQPPARRSGAAAARSRPASRPAAAPSRAAAARRGRPAPARTKSPVPVILGAVGLVVVIVIVAILVTSGRSGDTGGKTGANPPGPVARNDSAPAAAPSGSNAPATASRNVEDQVDVLAERREEYRRRKALAESEADLYGLAKWCKENALLDEMNETAKALLARDPDHPEVHRLLGHKKFQGENPEYADKWLTSEEDVAKAAAAEKDYQHRLATDSRFYAMEKAISSARHMYLRDVPHFAVREWPYVLFVEDFGSKDRNDYYSSEKADQVRAFWQHMNKTFPGLINKEREVPFQVIVFKDAASYNRFNSGQHAGSGSGGTTSRARAHFSLLTKFVYYYEKEAKGSNFDAEATLGVLFHECTHQLLNWLRPAQNEASPSMWFEEAFAEYIGAVKKTGKYEKDENGVDRMSFEISRVNKYRLPHIHQMIQLKHIFSLPTMFRCRTYDEANSTFRIKFGQAGGHGQLLLYSEGWSFVYFCMNEPSGKYRDKMIDYIKKDAAGDSFGYETLCESFGLGRRDEEWQPIEREWLAYVRRLQPDGTLKERK